GVVTIAALAYTSLMVARTSCVYCLGTYACVIAIAALSFRTSPAGPATLASHIGRDIGRVFGHPSRLVAAVLFVAGLVGYLAWFPADDEPAATSTDGARGFSRATAAETSATSSVPTVSPDQVFAA